MKKFTPYLIVLIALLSFTPNKVKASHAAGAEIIYEWISDSTYRIYLHFYRDCSGIPEPTTMSLCVRNSCTAWDTTINMAKTLILPGGASNGTEVLLGCPTSPTYCEGGTLPGYREWWYACVLTLNYSCDKWTMSHAESARNSIANFPGGGNLYVEATFDNKDAQGNSSAYFTVKPVPYVCDNIAYTYNNGAFDPNNDSLYFQMIAPRSGSDCSPSSMTWGAGYGLPSNPLACGSTFTFSSSTGQMAFTPNATGQYALSMQVTEYRYLKSAWKAIGTVMRDIQVVVLPCSTPTPKLTTDSLSLSGAKLISGTIDACATVPFNFCYNCTSTDTAAVLVVSDNSSSFFTSTKPTVTYKGMYTDSIRGCFSWKPGAFDSGLKVYAVTVKDSTCKGIAVPISNTFVIPIYVWPVTIAYFDTTICPGGVVNLNAIGGAGFTWTAVGGSGSGSLSCLTCKSPIASPTSTTRYIVLSARNTVCARNTDSVTIKVVPAPSYTRTDTAACNGTTINLSVTVPTPDTGISTSVKWVAAPGTPGGLLSSTTIPNPSIKMGGTTGKYYVNITYAGLTSCSSVDTVVVRSLNYFTLFNKDSSVCRGSVFQMHVIGDPAYNYTWTPAAGLTSSKITQPYVTADTTITYTLTARHAACPDSSESITVTVEPSPLVSAGQDKLICEGDTVHLYGTVNPSNYSGYTYTWSPDSVLIDAGRITAIFNGHVSQNISFTVSTAAGCTGSDTVHVTVVPSNFLTISPDTGICPGDTAQLRISGDSLVTVQWTPANFIDNKLSYTPKVWPNTTTTYSVLAVNNKGCRDVQPIKVTVHPAAVLQLPDSIELYPGDSYQIEPGGNCLYFQWTPPVGLSATNISNPVAQPLLDTKYLVNAQTEAGCKISDSISIYMADDSWVNIPNGFMPKNGPFKVVHIGRATLKSFTIYDRWGVKMFESTDVNEGWDGTYNGKPQPAGVYIFVVEAYSAKGVRFYKKGNVTLLR